MKRYCLLIIVIVAVMIAVTPALLLAADQPHNTLGCSDCHTFHGAPGTSLTVDASNANLCMSCHNPGGSAPSKPFNDGMQANPGLKGTSHRWNASMPATSDPANQYGLRAVADLTSGNLKTRLGNFGNVVTCSVCHDQHSQSLTPWDPFASSTPGDSGRHFMRDDNDLNQMCEDCHYYRTVSSGQTNVRTYDGKKKSHPLVKSLAAPDVSDPTTFVGTAPLEPNMNSQTTSPRYHQNGTGDANLTNNLVFDSSGKMRCLTCHGVHYTDSDSSTVDGP